MCVWEREREREKATKTYDQKKWHMWEHKPKIYGLCIWLIYALYMPYEHKPKIYGLNDIYENTHLKYMAYVYGSYMAYICLMNTNLQYMA